MDRDVSVVPRVCWSLPLVITHNRVHLVAHASDGTTLTADVDSGGGADFIDPALQARLQLAPAGEVVNEEGKFALVDYPSPFGMPRMTVTIDGKPLLLDPGAMIPLTGGGALAFHVEPGTIVGG